MRSEQTFSFVQSAKEIHVAIDSDGDRIGGLLNERHPLPVGEGEQPFDYRRHLLHLDHQLTLAVDDAVVAEDDLVAQQIRVSRLRNDRDDLVDVGYDTLVSARQGFESLFERGGFELAHVSGDTPRAPNRLIEQLVQSVKLLRRPAVNLRGFKVEGFSVDLDKVADGLDSAAVNLRTGLDLLDAANKRAEGLLVVKRKKADVLRRTLLWVGRTTEGLFHLAGEDELAARIRKSTRRSASPPDDPAEEPAVEESPADESSPEAPAS